MNKKQLPSYAAKIANKAGRVVGKVFPVKKALQTERNMMTAQAAQAMKNTKAMMPTPISAPKMNGQMAKKAGAAMRTGAAAVMTKPKITKTKGY